MSLIQDTHLIARLASMQIAICTTFTEAFTVKALSPVNQQTLRNKFMRQSVNGNQLSIIDKLQMVLVDCRQ